MAADPARLPALDLLRGAAVAGMLLVTMPGDWAFTYAELRHADWNGWTLADLVFPAFLFSTGMDFGLAVERARAAAPKPWARVGARALRLIALGVGLEVTYNLAIAAGAHFPGHGDLAHLRLPGVLQRIGLCYGLAGALVLATARAGADGSRRIGLVAVAGASAGVLVGYGLLLALVPVPGFGAGRLDPVASLPAYLDRSLFTPAHLWVLAVACPGGPPTYDPEGLLSTLPATVDVLFGVMAARVWRARDVRAPSAIALAGLAAVALGLLLAPAMPINKRLWTPSFALFSGGVAAVSLAALARLARQPLVLRLMAPLQVLGANAIAAFVLATGISRFSGFDWFAEAGRRETSQAWGDHLMLRLIPEPHLAALACALAMTALITLALWPLHRRGVHLRL